MPNRPEKKKPIKPVIPYLGTRIIPDTNTIEVEVNDDYIKDVADFLKKEPSEVTEQDVKNFYAAQLMKQSKTIQREIKADEEKAQEGESVKFKKTY